MKQVAHELILGGQKSGKSRRAELLALQWLQESPAHQAVLIATAQAFDAEMQARIARHQQERQQRVPALRTQEESLNLAQAIGANSHASTLLVVDCLTLWLTNWLMPMCQPGVAEADEDSVLRAWHAQQQALLSALRAAAGPVVLVSNEIGWGVIPMGREVRRFVDCLGSLNQQVAQCCRRVTLVAAGLPLSLKGDEG